MCSYFHCALYSDIDSKIRIDKDAVYITLEDEKNDVDLHITLNPCQILTFAKYLYAAISEVALKDILESSHFGNLTVQIENENINTENFKIPLGCQDGELFYPPEYDELETANC
ncbi:MAG: hypothetical protein IK062_01205 [Selenomonadaceae bacterium]|nr:hypothetical protein [Selenomonadaceae bacterium]